MTMWVGYVLASAVLCWLQLLGASMLHAQAWTLPGLQRAFGNRADMPDPTPFVGRTKRAATNMVENLPLMLAAVLAASASGGSVDRLNLGMAVFFWCRVGHAILYMAGVPYARTAAWFASLFGLVYVVSGIPWA